MVEAVLPEVGDIVDVAPHRKGVYGVRVGRVMDVLECQPYRCCAVEVPGEREWWLVPLEHLTVVGRLG